MPFFCVDSRLFSLIPSDANCLLVFTYGIGIDTVLSLPSWFGTGPLVRRSVIPKVHYSEGPMCTAL